MPKRVLRWFVEGNIGRIKVGVGGKYRLDADYYPESVYIGLRRATSGDRPLKVNILADDVTIFDEKPAITDGITDKVWTTVIGNVLREGSIISLNIDQVADEDPGEDLTVELTLN
jgi:hypothetical protein